MVWRTSPAAKRSPAERARLWKPEQTAARCSMSRRRMPSEQLSGRPSAVRSTAWRTWSVLATRSSSSQPRSVPGGSGVPPRGSEARSECSGVWSRSIVGVRPFLGVGSPLGCGPGGQALAAAVEAALEGAEDRADLLGGDLALRRLVGGWALRAQLGGEGGLPDAGGQRGRAGGGSGLRHTVRVQERCLPRVLYTVRV